MKEAILLTDGYKLAHHKMYSEGIQTLSENYDRVIITNSYKNWEIIPNNVTVYSVI